MRYEYLIRILDQIRLEAPDQQKSTYRPPETEHEKVNQARARAFIHLYMKVMFGLADFRERERTITDKGYDGGIDGYYIDTDAKTIHFIQSKFRTTQKNFEGKEITLEEILAMDVARIMEGEQTDEAGNPYNGKIKQLQREASSIGDIARYSYRVVILANLKGVPSGKLRLLTGGFSAEVFDFERAYDKLVFPVITGTYFCASDIVIPIDLSNKNAGSKISYSVKTKHSDCEITVLFVPAIEIAKIMNKYKNAVLKYNPRSYLDLAGQSVNDAIRDTIVNTRTNEFALFNNGITMLSEETNINEKIGQKNKAQLRVKAPQIINGGQTSFTLSRILNDFPDTAEDVFSDKEVLLKIITVAECAPAKKIELIDEISVATNRQTPVINADKFANDEFHVEIQKKVFERYGMLYERKRGEFSDGVRDGYVAPTSIIERNHFWRLYFTANGKIDRGFQKKLFQKNEFPGVLAAGNLAFDRLYLASIVFDKIATNKKPQQRPEKGAYGKVYAYVELYLHTSVETNDAEVNKNIANLQHVWSEFIDLQRNKDNPGQRTHIDKATGETKKVFSEHRYYRGHTFERDLVAFMQTKKQELQ